MSNHTPGPWTVARGSHCYPLEILSESKTIAQVERSGSKQETEANANVLAASAELLAVCEELAARIVECLGCDESGTDPNDSLSACRDCGGVGEVLDGEPDIGALRDAIAKAKGKQE